MRLVRLILENFQSHAHTELELSPGLTVIVGESDRGKSALIRALRWLFFNEPRGADFIRAGESECRVTAVFADGTSITRERSTGRNRNRYIVSRPGEEEKIFEGFGQEVPAEVTALHGVRPVGLDGDLALILNLAAQLDPPFLLSAVGGVRARAIGRLHGVHLVDAALRDVLQDIARLQREERRLAEEIGALDERLAEYGDLPGLEERLHRAGRLMDGVSAAAARRSDLAALARKLSAVREEGGRLKGELARLSGIPEGLVRWAQLSALGLRRDGLSAAATRWEALRRQHEAMLARWRACAGVDRGRELLFASALAVERLNRLRQLRERLRAVAEERRRQQDIDRRTERLPEGRRRLAELERLPGLKRALTVQLNRLRRLRMEEGIYLNTVRQTDRVEEGPEKLHRLARLVDRLLAADGARARMAVVEAEKARHRSVLEKTAGVESARARIFAVDRLLKNFAALAVWAGRLAPLRAERLRQQGVYDATGSLDRVAAALMQLEDLRRRAALLDGLAGRLVPLRRERGVLAGRLSRTANVPEGRRVLAELAGLPVRLELLRDLDRRLREARERQQRGREFLAGVEKDLSVKTGLYIRALKELGRCPTCLAPVDAATMERIASGFRKTNTGEDRSWHGETPGQKKTTSRK